MGEIATAHLQHAFGFRIGVNGAVAYQNENTIVYPCGSNLVIYNTIEHTQSFISGLAKSRKMSAMAISPNRRYVAVAETSEENRPVILIYDLKILRKIKILSGNDTLATEFTCIAFSPDSKYVVGQTAEPDWVLIYWAWEKSKELASLKLSTLSSKFTVNQVSFCPNDSSQVCVAGNNFLKIFRYSDNKLKNLAVMKVELQNFCCHCWVADDSIVLGTGFGNWILVTNGEVKKEYELSIMDDETSGTKDTDESKPRDPSTSIVKISNGFVLSRGLGKVIWFEKTNDDSYYKKLFEIRIPTDLKSSEPSKTGSQRITDLCISPSEHSLVCCTDINQLYHFALTYPYTGKIGDFIYFDLLSYSFHHSGIRGLDICHRKPLVGTCAADRSVRIWNYETSQLVLSKDFPEEAHSIALHPSGHYLLVGFSDRLRLMNILLDDIVGYKEFQLGNCKEIAFSHGGHCFAAAQKNNIHIYSTANYELIVCLKGHIDVVQNVLWTNDDRKLISCGMDGAVYEWDICTGQRCGESVIKTCGYTGITVTSDGVTTLAVATDKSLREIANSHIITDVSNLDVQLTSLALSSSGKMLFCGTSKGTIRSFKLPLLQPIRFHEFAGHSSKIVRMKITPHDDYLVTISDDSSIMIWQLGDPEQLDMRRDNDLKWTDEVLVTKIELDEKNNIISELRTYVDDIKAELNYQVGLSETYYTDKIKQITEKFITELETLKSQNTSLKLEKDNDVVIQAETLKELISHHNAEIRSLEIASSNKLTFECQRYEELQKTVFQLQTQNKTQIESIETMKDVAIEELTQYYEAKITESTTIIENLIKDTRDKTMEYDGMKNLIEEDADREILETKIKFGKRLQEEKLINGHLKGENGILMKKFHSLQKEIDDQKYQIKKFQTETSKLEHIIRNLETDKIGLSKEIHERDETIQGKEKRIYEFKNKNQELCKFKFVLEYRVTELTKELEPMALQILQGKHQAEEMEVELGQFKSKNQEMIIKMDEMRHKVRFLEREVKTHKQGKLDVEAQISRLKSDLYKCVGNIQEPRVLKDAIIALYKKYVMRESKKSIYGIGDATGEDEAVAEFARHRTHLERSVAGLKRKLTKDITVHRTTHLRIMQENVELINEINCLRMTLKNERSHIKDLESALGLHGKHSDIAKKTLAKFSDNKPKPFEEKELEEALLLMESQRSLIDKMRIRIVELESYQYGNSNSGLIESIAERSLGRLPPLETFR